MGSSVAARRRGSLIAALLVVTAGTAGTIAAASGAVSLGPGTPMIDGTLRVAHGDDFSGHNVNMSAEIDTAHGKVPVHVTPAQHARLMSLAGKRVRGKRPAIAAANGSAAQVDAASITPTGPAASVVSNRRIAVVLLRTHGTSTDQFPTSTAQSTFFGASNSVKDWFAQGSDGAVTVTGHVYGWYTSAITTPDCSGSVFLDQWLNEAASKASADGYNAANYDNLVVYTPNFSGVNCNFAGIAWVGLSGVLLNGYMQVGVAAHELGHNQGLWHAGSLACGGVSIGGSCTRTDYGDPYDVMGNAGAAHAYNGAHKLALGWMPSSEVQNVTTGTPSITLTSSARPVVASSTELITIPRHDGTHYAIEKREPYGTYDASMSGVYIRIVGLAGTDDTQLLDMTPETSTFSDAALAEGATFTDSANSVSITNSSEGTSTATIQVNCAGTCGVPSTTTTSTTVPRTNTHTTFNCNIKSVSNGQYVSAELGYGGNVAGTLRARASTVGSWEKFQCVAVGSSSWAIKSRANGKYVSAELGYPSFLYGLLRARASSIGTWERFTITPVSGCSCSGLKSANRLYSSAELGYGMPLTAAGRSRAASAGAWEKFVIVVDAH